MHAKLIENGGFSLGADSLPPLPRDDEDDEEEEDGGGDLSSSGDQLEDFGEDEVRGVLLGQTSLSMT